MNPGPSQHHQYWRPLGASTPPREDRSDHELPLPAFSRDVPLKGNKPETRAPALPGAGVPVCTLLSYHLRLLPLSGPVPSLPWPLAPSLRGPVCQGLPAPTSLYNRPLSCSPESGPVFWLPKCGFRWLPPGPQCSRLYLGILGFRATPNMGGAKNMSRREPQAHSSIEPIPLESGLISHTDPHPWRPQGPRGWGAAPFLAGTPGA